MHDVTGPFKKSSYSGDQGDCVEVAPLAGGGRAVRDSKDRDGGVQFYSAAEWRAFIAGVRAGEFDV